MKPPLENFTHLGKTVILRPGNIFTKNELQSRLEQMNIEYDPSLSKNYLIHLYDTALKDEKNQIKIFDKLIKVTLYYDKVLNNREKSLEYSNPNLEPVIDNIKHTIECHQTTIIFGTSSQFNIPKKEPIIDNTYNTTDNPKASNTIETPKKSNNPNKEPKKDNINNISDPKPISAVDNKTPNNGKEKKDSGSNISFIYIIIIGVLLWQFQKYLSLLVIPFLIGKIIEYNNLDKCKDIYKDIKNDLRNAPMDSNGIRSISENDIIEKYSEKYNIDYNTFVNDYLEKLKILLENDNSLIELKNKNSQGVVVTKWELVKTD